MEERSVSRARLCCTPSLLTALFRFPPRLALSLADSSPRSPLAVSSSSPARPHRSFPPPPPSRRRLTVLRLPSALPLLSRSETARSHATRARPAGWHSVAFSAVHLRVSQSVSQSLSQSVGESGRSSTRQRYRLFSLCTPCVTTLYSHLSRSLSLSLSSAVLSLSLLLVPGVRSSLSLFPLSLSLFLSCFLFSLRLSSALGDQVARLVCRGLSLSVLSPPFTPPSNIVQCVATLTFSFVRRGAAAAREASARRAVRVGKKPRDCRRDGEMLA